MSGCDGKRRFETKDFAQLWAQRERGRLFARTRPYRCTLCGGWHLAAFGSEERAFRRRPTRGGGA